MKPESITVKYRTVSVTVFPWSPRPGVQYWKFHNGKKTVVRNTLEKAKAEASRIAQETYLGTAKLGFLSDSQARAVRRMLEADPSLASVDEFLSWRSRRGTAKPCRVAVGEFLAAKRAASGASRRNLETLAGHLAFLPDLPLADIRVTDLPELAGAARTRDNRRRAWVTFFRWCVDREWLPHGEKTAAERIEAPRVVAGIPETLSPDELGVLLENVSPEYLPWLACSAFAGIRNSEMSPVASDKPPLDWSDFHWSRNVLIVRPETSKTGRRRVIPILSVLAAWLRPVALESGRVCPERNPTHGTRKVEPETARLGALIGGWKANALRHSFISYFAAMHGISAAAQAAGNSEAIARRSYQDAKSKADAKKWFGLIPVKYPRPTLSVLPPVSKKPAKSRLSSKMRA